MLIEFNVTNYRSIREIQTLSMVASKDTSHEDANCIQTGISAIPRLIRAAVLYGPNASGKSNLISALSFMRRMITRGEGEGQTLDTMPFRFDPETTDQPSEFEIIFVESGIRYQYGFALNKTCILREWLLVYVERKAQRWFEREYDSEKNTYNWYFGSHLMGGKQQHQLWKNSTRTNALFLSTAVNLNSEQLRPVFNWFAKKLVIVAGNKGFNPHYTVNRVKDDVEKTTNIVDFLQAADLGITGLNIEMRKVQVKETNATTGSDEPRTQMMKDIEIPFITLLHLGKNSKNIPLDFDEESQGTQHLFAYAGPILDILQRGYVLVVDELDSSLHPHIVRFLISLFHNPKLNQHNAQLLFSTHNTSLLDTDLFRRDQIWFVEKNPEQASRLYPLSDFSPRKGEALEKGYLIGRYGALPFLGELKL